MAEKQRREKDPAERVIRHSRKTVHHRRFLQAFAAVLALLVGFSGTAFAMTYVRLQGNINRQDISSLLGGDRPTDDSSNLPTDQLAGTPLNILVIGSDIRSGDSDIDGAGSAGEVGGMRSDTTMVVHISADRTRIEVVSIPRDTLVDVPSCTLPDGTQTAPQRDVMFNSAFATGGQTGDPFAAAACTIRTVENLSGVYINDFVIVDFAGFINVIDALGGISMCIAEDIDDPQSGLQLAAGCQTLDGWTALGYARARYTLGDGSDISRIGRQQELVMAVLDRALSTSLLTNPARLYQFLDAATQTLTTGQNIGSISEIAGLGMSLGNIRTEDLVMATMPFYYSGARVVPAEPYATEVWGSLQTDTPVDPLLTGEGSTIQQALNERAQAEQAALEASQTPTDSTGATADPTAPPEG